MHQVLVTTYVDGINSQGGGNGVAISQVVLNFENVSAALKAEAQINVDGIIEKVKTHSNIITVAKFFRDESTRI